MTPKPKSTHGGARPGAGRPRKTVTPLTVPKTADPLQFLLSVVNDAGADPTLRVKAAQAALPFLHQRPGATGKKEQAQQAAERVAGGKFKAAPLPGSVTPIRPDTDWGDDLMTPDSALN
jgi:phage terminase small subunit